MEHIDVIFYINLEHRTDRRAHIEAEIAKVCTDATKVIRINAVKHHIGVVGCCMSHILALEEFEKHPEWNTCMILEDDFTFRHQTFQENNTLLKLAMDSIPNWDVFILAFNPAAFTSFPTHIDIIKKVTSTQTTSGYVIHKKYLNSLLANFKEGVALKQLYPQLSQYCLDIYWKQIQPTGNWYTVVPALGYQCESYSDIEQRVVDYKC